MMCITSNIMTPATMESQRQYIKKRVLGRYRVRISISIDPKAFELLEKARGKVTRSTYIEDLIFDG